MIQKKWCSGFCGNQDAGKSNSLSCENGQALSDRHGLAGKKAAPIG
jgi:hypothetical protein